MITAFINPPSAVSRSSYGPRLSSTLWRFSSKTSTRGARYSKGILVLYVAGGRLPVWHGARRRRGPAHPRRSCCTLRGESKGAHPRRLVRIPRATDNEPHPRLRVAEPGPEQRLSPAAPPATLQRINPFFNDGTSSPVNTNSTMDYPLRFWRCIPGNEARPRESHRCVFNWWQQCASSTSSSKPQVPRSVTRKANRSGIPSSPR
jgi:hypothetical protein